MSLVTRTVDGRFSAGGCCLALPLTIAYLPIWLLCWLFEHGIRHSRVACMSKRDGLLSSFDALLEALDGGFEVNTRFPDGPTLLHIAAIQPTDHVELVRLLLLRGANTEIAMPISALFVPQNGWHKSGLVGANTDRELVVINETAVTALSAAVVAGHAACTNALLDAGAHSGAARQFAATIGSDARIIALLTLRRAPASNIPQMQRPNVQHMHSSVAPAVPNPLYVGTGGMHAQGAAAECFAALDTDGDGFITGNEARDFFERSELPTQSLREIWESIPKRRYLHLDAREFEHMFAAVKACRTSIGSV